jgi:RND family efflux transporter MFP subunit
MPSLTTYHLRAFQSLWHTAILLLVVAIAAGCSATEGRGRRPGSAPDVTVLTTGVQRMPVDRTVELAGTLMSPDQAKVSSEVAGVVRDVPVELGREVRPGDPLVLLEPRELKLALDRAQSALRQTEAQLGIRGNTGEDPPPDEEIASVRTASANRDDARAQYQRAERLVSRGLLPQVELQSADTRLKVAEANYQAALDNVRSLKASLLDRRAAYELAQKKLDDAVIRAPVAGSVAERLVQPGEYIRENTPVITLVQVNPLKLRTAIQERHAGAISPGLGVEFHVEPFPSEVFRGKVAYVSPAVDQATRTFVVEALVDNPDRRLKPGLFAKGTIVTQHDQVMAVSEDAVSTLAGVSAVYVVENGKIRQQTVTVGVRQGKLLEVVDGLKGDEVLAASNLSQLATGTPVRAETARGAPGVAGEPAGGRRQRPGSAAAGGASATRGGRR